MKRTEKEQLVNELKGKITGAQALYFTDFTGLNVKRMTALRRELRADGAGLTHAPLARSVQLAARGAERRGRDLLRRARFRSMPRAWSRRSQHLFRRAQKAHL